MSENWLYQVRIRLRKEIAEAVRFDYENEIAEKILNLAKKHKTSLVCTLDAFSEVFGRVRMRSDPFGCVWIHSDAFGCVRKFRKHFGSFREKSAFVRRF